MKFLRSKNMLVKREYYRSMRKYLSPRSSRFQTYRQMQTNKRLLDFTRDFYDFEAA